jgi:CDGSH-type Zn-finger protein/uncharacterized Fe-S cluster protein YjdI
MVRKKEYKGSDITVSFEMSRCIHARNCFLKLPEVFDPAQRPWVQPDTAPAEEIAAIVRSCPSGALAFQYADATTEAAPKINRIAVLENGPLAIAGDVSLEDDAPETRLTLCRCGLSKNKPYCDFSHVDGGFVATGEPTPTTPDDVAEQGGHMAVKRVPDGPLIVDGHVEVTTGTGRKISKQSKLFLCRCGASQNKPFCDGRHKAVGFKDAVQE